MTQPNSLLKKALTYNLNINQALDIGFGEGRDTMFLLSKNVNVSALDINKHHCTQLASLQKQKKLKNLKIINDDIVNYNLQKWHYDLVNCQWIMFFIKEEKYEELIERIWNSLKPQGIFTGQFLGIKDEWNQLSPHNKLSFIKKAAFQKLFSHYFICYQSEELFYKTTKKNIPKKWHVHNVIAQKKISA